MAEHQDQERTEAPTPRRRQQARDEGQIVFSPDLNSALLLLMIALGGVWVIPALAQQLSAALRTRLITLDGGSWGVTATVMSVRWLVAQMWWCVGAIVVLTAGWSLAVSQIQSGFVITSKSLELKWERLSPIEGWNRVFSWDSLFRGLIAVLKAATLGSVAAVVFWLWREELITETRGTLVDSVGLAWRFLSQLMLSLGGAAFVWGAADYGFRWFRNEQKLRMSREELKDEHKEDNGDPQLKGRMRRMQKDAAQRKTLRDVAGASVVITNPTHFAVALKYEPGRMTAPRVVSKGADQFARRIIATAREHGVPVIEKKPLARALYALAEVGQDIPLEFYRAVAEILAQVFRARQSR